MSRIRVLYMGTPEFAVPALRALLAAGDTYEVVGVVTQPDRPAGRGRKLTPSPVKDVALEHGLPVLQPAKMKAPETREAMAALAPDVAVVAAYGRILPPALLSVPRRGCINLHASILPRFRGASPIARAIWAGDRETGVSIMQMDEGLDTGPVYDIARLSIAPDDTTAALTTKLAELGARALLEVLPRIMCGELAPTPQPSTGVTHAPPLAKADGALDWHQPAAVLERQVRAMQPWPGAFTELRGERIQIGRAHVVADQSGEPGVVLRADKHGVVVACGEQALCLDEVQPPGRRMMPAAAWVTGRGATAGDRFAAPPRA